MTKQRIVKISVIALAALLLLGGACIGLPYLRGIRIKNGKFPSPDRVIISIVKNGEIVERELSRDEQREYLKLFDDPISQKEEGVYINVGGDAFFDHYEQYGAVKFLYDKDYSYEYLSTPPYPWQDKTMISCAFNAVYFVVSEGYTYAYEAYNATVLRCNGIYFYEMLNRQEHVLNYFSQKEG